MKKLKQLLNKKEVKKTLWICGGLLLAIILLIEACHSSKSMALTAFTYLIIFDLTTVLTIILDFWIQSHGPTTAFSYGFKRCEVLAVFTCTMLAILASIFVFKECGRFMPATFFAFSIHMLVTKFVENKTFEHVIDASSSSWLQEHATDMSESLCRYVPGLRRLLLPRVNPFSLLGFACLIIQVCTYLMLQMGSSYLVDLQGAILISIFLFATMVPMTWYTAKILLQTTPMHLIAQIDKSLREASTLDGVLEFRNEHFWTLSFGVIVGSLHVRVRRDADEQLVLAHVWTKLAGLVQILTIHIFKDDWIRRTTHQLVYNNSPSNMIQSPSMTPPPPPSIQPPAQALLQPTQLHQQSAPYASTTTINMNQSRLPHQLFDPNMNRSQTNLTNPIVLNSRKPFGNAVDGTSTVLDP